MTAQKKRNPTNSELLSELKALRQDVKQQGEDVQNLKQWRRDTEIAKTAVTEYLKDNPQPQAKPTQGSDRLLNQELVKTLGVALAVILALVTLIAQLKGITLR